MLMADSITTENPATSIDPSTPFCARTYYSALRDLGVDPLVCQQPDGSLGEHTRLGANNGVGDVSHIVDWAMAGDPDWSLRNKYVFFVLENRPASDLQTEFQIVPLGV